MFRLAFLINPPVAHSFQSEHIIDISYSSKLDETKEKALGGIFAPLLCGVLTRRSGSKLGLSDSRKWHFLGFFT